MRNAIAGALLIILYGVAAARAAAIEHKPVGCVVADKFPRLEARLAPAESVARARVFFRAEGSPAWYSVAMARQGEAFVTHLPKPKKSLAAFRYYIEAADAGMATSRTEERTAKVVAAAGECEPDLMGMASAVATVLLEAPAGAAAIPAGFSSAGVVTAAAQTAGAAGAATGAASGGGGLGTAAIVGGGIVVAGGAAAAAVATGAIDVGQEEDDNNALYQVTFTSPGIDVSVCAGRPLSWCCQPIEAAGNGAFDDTWSAMDPGTLRVTGTLTASTVTGSMRCTNGAASGTLNAAGGGGNYTGTFEFAGQRGNITVTRDNR